MVNALHGNTPSEKVTKLEAARRQLATAIELWFNDGDTVSIYTLSHAAYEVIHNFTKKSRSRDLLFDTLIIKDEYRKQFNSMLREPANFFKHHRHNNPENPEIEFHPELCQIFFFFSIFGLELAGYERTDEESVFSIWYMIHTPDALTDKGREELLQFAPVESLDMIRQIGKRQFFEGVMEARREFSRRT